MAEAASPTPAIERQREPLLKHWDEESATTLKVLRAYPPGQAGLRPHPRAKDARELAWMFTMEMGLAGAALRDEMHLSRGLPPAPGSMEEVTAAFEAARESFLDELRQAPAERLAATTRFPTGPHQVGDWPMVDFLWFLLHDQIHHRGQFSVYLRMSGAKVPSIYGPSADEPWM
jgi:uncharacterized damage-inducible protein DinB